MAHGQAFTAEDAIESGEETGIEHLTNAQCLMPSAS